MRFLKNRNSGAMFLILEGIVFTMIINIYNPFIQMFEYYRFYCAADRGLDIQ